MFPETWTLEFPFTLWEWHDAGLIPAYGVHYVLGLYFGYPVCCVDTFLEEYPYPRFEKKCPILGTYAICEACYAKEYQ